MTITLSWYMLVPLVWVAGMIWLTGHIADWEFDSFDLQYISIFGIVPAALMLLTRFLP